MNAETDSSLLLRWQRQGDAHAFHEIANRHSAMVFATCRRVLRDAVEAEDLTQECFLTLAQQAGKPPDSLPAWLHVVAVRRSLTRIRTLGRRAARERSYAERQPVAVEPAVADVLAEVDEALAALPETLRTPLVLHFLEQRGQGEIAAQLGVTQSTVSRRIVRGIAKLRTQLEKKHIVVSAGVLAAGLQAEAQMGVPASLSAALGKLSLGGNSVGSSGAAGVSVAKVAAIGGGILMKKALVGAAGLAVIAFGIFWVSSNRPASPPPGAAAPVDVAANVEPPAADTAPAAAETTAASDGPIPVEAIAVPIHGGGIISGRVLDAASGEGIPGATVTAAWRNGGDPAAKTDKELSSVSGADGAYRLDGLAGPAGTRYELTRDTPEGYRRPSYMEKVAIVLDESGHVSGVDIALHREVPLGGTVVDERGRPIGGAKVLLGGGMDFIVGESTDTDPGGRFSFHGLPPTSDLGITAKSGEELTSEPYTFTLPKEGITDLTLRVLPACAVSGTVVDSDGKALEGYVVRCLRVPSSRSGGGGGGSEETGKGGQFEVSGLAPGDYELVAFKSTMAGMGPNQKGSPIALTAGQQLTGVTVVYGRDLSIAGRVTNLDGEPLEGMSIMAGSSEYGGSRAKTDSGGYFTLENLEDGDYQVDIRPKDGYQFMSLGGVLAGTKDLAIVLPGYFQVNGRVLDARTGQPIPEFEIVLQVNWSDSLDSWMAKQFQTVSNPEGRFELQQTQLFRSMLAARAPGYATGMKVLDLTGPPYEHEVELKLEPGQDVNGKVVDARGAPVAGASIFFGRIQALGDRAITQSAEDGSFQLASFPAAPQMVAAYHPSYAPAWITVEGTARFRPVEIVLSDGGAIEGNVTFAGETALACEASIAFDDYHFVPEMTAAAAADGTFRIERVKPGEATVVLAIGTDLPFQERLRYIQTVSVQAGRTTAVHFDIQPYTGGLEGVLQYPQDALPSRVLLKLECATDTGAVKRVALVAADGRFYFDRMPGGPATLEIDAGFQNHRRIATTVDVELPDGDIAYVEIPL